eukprot:s419_g16.t1
MATPGEESAQAVGAGPLTAVPWNQIPRFVPGETDVQVYARKLEFLKALWPKEHIEHLGPRAALLVEGIAFQKVSRLDPAKLKEPEGVTYLVHALGGQWGRLDAEETLNLFEKALYMVSQKPDETHDSYLARHDAAFEDLINKKVSIEEVRAYVLLRQSLLTPDERKRIIMEKGGNLTYEDSRKQIRLLGSKFFQELQTGSGSRASKLKTYDIHHVDDENYQWTEDDDDDEETFISMMAENGDEDACFVADFEEQILVACQESAQLASCFTTYQEARFRLKEKARNRGFWPPSASKGRGRGGKGFKGRGSFQNDKSTSWHFGGQMGVRKKTLADRIASSTCRKCGRPGHWKRECPMNQGGSTMSAIKKPEGESFTGLMIEDEGYEMLALTTAPHQGVQGDLIEDLPPDAEVLEVGDKILGRSSEHMGIDRGVLLDYCDVGSECFHLSHGPFRSQASSSSTYSSMKSQAPDLTTSLIHRLMHCCRSIEPEQAALPTANSEPAVTGSTFLPSHSDFEAGGACILNVEEADDEAIIDTGASKAVIGKERLTRLLHSFPKELRSRVMRVPTEGVVFKFGNAGRLSSEFAVLLPRSKNDWLRVEVVETRRAMASPVHYLKQELTAPIDPGLQIQQQHQEMPAELTRPPGVATLEEWGCTRTPSGKHQGKKFSEIYEEDRACVNQMWNRKAVASWVRSFQLYWRHRRAASVENQERETKAAGLQMPLNPHMTPEVRELIAAGGAPWFSPRTNAEYMAKAKAKKAAKPTTPRVSHATEPGWQKIDTEEKNHKRGYPSSSAPTMEIQPNEDRVRDLQTQIALLQRRRQVGHFANDFRHVPGRTFENAYVRGFPTEEDSGKFQYQGKWTSISAYAQAYTAQFARRVVPELLKNGREEPLLIDEMILGLEHERPELAHESVQLQKRRRVELKQPESSLYGRAPSWKDIFRQAGYETPRVGGHRFEDGSVLFKLIQQLVPEFTVKLVIACRGTERHRTDGVDQHGDKYPWRKTVIVHRETGEIEETGPAEEWLKIPSSAAAKSSNSDSAMEDVSTGNAPPSAEVEDQHMPQDSSEVPQESVESTSSEGWAPKIIPKSGPRFLALSRGDQSELRRLHVNLGHPDPAKFARFLAERNARPEVIEGSKDMCCDTCIETQNKPKLSQPGRIHDDLDFNDLVGADGAYWKNKHGHVFHFMHFIDESTLFHVGALSERKVESQIQVYQEAWVQWAGPCRMLYLDPAGEYVSDAWAAHLQSDGTQVSMTAAEAHWQNGRCEAHGNIVKSMLTRMEKDIDIDTEQEFTRCLRQVFAAKNSLSRVNGFTPEQCLLGKSKHLPGSLVSDENAGSHALAESSTPEGLRFRQSLLRRELARKAYVQADNDSAFRRALLRQNRPGKVELQKGDWVLYWRKSHGNSRISRGRWHGPAQVIAVEQRKVVWLSHLGRLVRASPEQIRPASLREYLHLPRDLHGQVVDEKPQGRNYVELEGEPDGDEVSHDGVSHEVAEEYSPGTPMNTSEQASQPEDESFPEENPETVPNQEDQGIPTPHEVPVPEWISDDDGGDCLFGDDVTVDHVSGVWEIVLDDFEWETQVADAFCENPGMFEQIWLTTGEKRKRVEVNYRALNAGDRALFDAAKQKEVKAWLDHGTVKRVAKGTLSPEQVMRCRWILTWKPPAVGCSERRAKARLVVLGFEDPGIQAIPNDAPTLSKDGKQLLLQQVSSRKWRLINFDISTAFLKGQGDGRPLGIHPPEEVRTGLGMKEGEQCALDGGAYGRIDAPYLWYQAFKATLESLGFVACPLDGCLFSLITPDKSGKPIVRGVLGIHVDDGIGGGDQYYHEILGKLRKIYDFGAYNEGSFEFCGVRYHQWDDGSIEMDQVDYLRRIDPIEIPKHRRSTPNEDLTESEVQQLRRICGSLQFAAVHTRPDLAAKVGHLQSMVTKGKVQHLLEANRVLMEGKKNSLCLMVVPIPEQQVTFCSFSDAFFSTNKDSASRQGCLIFSTDLKLAQNERTVICPMAWSSKKIPRVVTSTLSAESISLSSALDRLGYIRVCWEWLKNPAVDWSDPSKILSSAPLASAVTDCKSVFDIATKTSTPSCSEYRTTLECLLIRERLQENVAMRWISTQAMLADSLTKSMDASVLRECLRTGKYSLFDEGESLKLRANKRDRLKASNVEPRAETESAVSCLFLHTSWSHLAVNVYCLWFLGRLAERLMGPGRFLFAFLMAGIGGSFASLLWKRRRRDPAGSAGASGSILGMLGVGTQGW